MVYAALILAEGKYYLLLDGKGNVRGFQSETDGIRYFEDGYNTAHGRGYTWSISAALNNMMFQPSIVGFESPEALFGDLMIAADQTCLRIGNVAGSMQVVEPDQDVAARLWENGSKPRMIS